MPTVSVLLTCYNHLRHLPEAVESVRKQTFKDYEIIAIDDGSTDGTREWLSAQQDIKSIFNASNLGTYATLNVGLHAAEGEFIAILNDDDVWAPTKLERQVEMMRDNPRIGLVHTDGSFIDADSLPIGGAPLGFLYPRFQTGRLLPALLYANKIIASAVLVRRACFDTVGGFNPDYFGSGDWEMWLRVAEAYDCGFVDEPLTLYRVHAGNASKKHDRIWRDDERLRLWIESRHYDDPKWGMSREEARDALAHNAACLGTVQMLNGDARHARAAYALSIRRRPARIKSYLRWALTWLPGVFRRNI